ncbi:hypothetical protein Tco_0335842, partial [Tanacetum coccineum]
GRIMGDGGDDGVYVKAFVAFWRELATLRDMVVKHFVIELVIVVGE